MQCPESPLRKESKTAYPGWEGTSSMVFYLEKPRIPSHVCTTQGQGRSGHRRVREYIFTYQGAILKISILVVNVKWSAMVKKQEMRIVLCHNGESYKCKGIWKKIMPRMLLSTKRVVLERASTQQNIFARRYFE
ncbi:hypothetical protein I7I50_02019 [Histoplasma capsulatum G186AR]|uniref:Uncharacterized protein n=1 Tax=Ajellomyces capsulatus TaxID=5037 RepID=A0A8H8CS61_AJECA|nr:hypothetical protein I7I52_12233 [Histoplasma capsulatum]QSS71251.1 hypothetical protein I7I50_02019 [Histoplasma capsulatum G186AR]